MENTSSRRVGQVVGVNTVAFVIAFAAWVMLGPSSRTIARELGLSPSTAALVKALPILTGALMRIPLGAAVDRLGARLVFPVLLGLGAAAAVALSFATTLTHCVLAGLALGMVGTTFAVGIQSVSLWTPPARQGLAMGIFGAGNVGTAATTFAMPLLLASMGWRGAFRVYAVVLVVTAIAYAVAMPTAPATARRSVRALLAPMWKRDAWYLGFLYMATFGVFVDVTLTLGDVYIDHYGVTARTAGLLATTFTLAASLVRIVGGALTDRFGASRVTRLVLPTVGLVLVPVLFGPSLSVVVALVMISGIAMGIGMASVMKLVPEYFPSSVGAVGGIVGALGGVAGFYLPILSAPIGRAFASQMQLLPAIALSLGAAAVFTLRSRRAAAVPATVTTLSRPPRAPEHDTRKAA